MGSPSEGKSGYKSQSCQAFVVLRRGEFSVSGTERSRLEQDSERLEREDFIPGNNRGHNGEKRPFGVG